MLRKIILAAIFISCFGLTGVSAQDNPTVINGGVVNGKAISLPKPVYPPAAAAIGAGGAVNVQVLIDEQGNVESAEAVSGHPLLRVASVAAARASKFAPTTLNGAAVKVKGIIVYNFNPPDKTEKENSADGESEENVEPDDAFQAGTPDVVDGTIVNGNAVSLPPPVYPPAARAVGASGVVNVRVKIDEKGNVVSAEAVSGHPLLRAAAEKAALRAKFSPVRLSGVPVKVSGTLVYNFVP